MQRNRTKRSYEKAVRVNITLPPLLHQESDALLKKYKFTCLSEYFQARMRRDLGLDLAA